MSLPTGAFSPPTASGGGGLTFTTLPDASILVGGTVPGTATYTVTSSGTFLGITGVRLEALEHGGLPFGGPGLMPGNGNFVLTELALDASGTPVPEPGTLVLFGSGILLCAARARRRNPDNR